jgi:ferredoxin
MAVQTKLRVAGESATQIVRAIGHDASLCLRETNAASSCSRCLDACPGHAIRLPKDAATPGGTKLALSKGFCIDCGLCCSACPTSSSILLEPTPRRLRHMLKVAQANAGGSGRTLYLTCIETGLAAEDPSVVEIPCLGALTPEVWVSLMLDFPNLAVYLPGDLCGRCKAKRAEGYIVDSVVEAQGIVGRDLPLVELRQELEFTDSKGRLLSESDEPFSEIGSGLGDIVHDITHGPADDGLSEEEHCNSDMRKTRTRLRKEITAAEGEQTPGLQGAEGLTGTLTVQRATILDAVMRFPQIAPNVKLRGVRANMELCTRCGSCVAGCPLGAASMDEDGVHMNRLVCVDCGLCEELCEPKAIVKVTTRVEDLLLADAPQQPVEG